jgi:GxxExxY protein
MVDLLLKEEVYRIIGACMEVHKQLGNGFLEAVYQEALEEEFKIQGIPYVREKQLKIEYKGKVLKKFYIADFVCFENIVVELKALSSLTNEHEAQVLNYLKTTGNKVGVLVNFGTSSLQYKRFVY